MRFGAGLILFTILTAGCSTSVAPDTGDVPRLAYKVTVAVFDATKRPASTSLMTFKNEAAVPGPYRTVARLNVFAKGQEEAVALNAIAYRARQLGAMGIIILPQEAPYTTWNASATDKNLRNFRAEAIVIESGRAAPGAR